MKSFTPGKLSHKDIDRKLFVILPVSPHDLNQGLALLDLWVDIEPSFNPDVGIGIALRYDLDKSAIPHTTVERLKSKFKEVHIFNANRIGTGWPSGCNALQVSAYQWFVEMTRDAKLFYNYMLMAEPDTIPLRPTWLSEISSEANASGAPIVGAYITKSDGGFGHINGNCCMHREMWKVIPEIWSVPPTTAWDVYIGMKALRYGKPSTLIFQHYQLGTEKYPWRGDAYLWEPKEYVASDNPLYGVKIFPAMLHGIKTMQGIEAVRAKYNLDQQTVKKKVLDKAQ